MAPMSLAASRHAANLALIGRLTTALKQARAAARVTGAALANETAKDERAILAKSRKPVPAPVVKGVKKVNAPVKKGIMKVNAPVRKEVKPSIPVVATAQRRGRPPSGECNQCRRLREGLPGGHGHAPWCTKKLYGRVEQ